MDSNATSAEVQGAVVITDEWELRCVPLDQIRLDGATQPRVELNDEVRREYRDLYKAGKDLGDLVLFHDDDGNYWLADGFHRRWGAVDAGLTEVLCTVWRGSLDDARWYSYAANQRHGLRRTNDDKRKAVKSALLHPVGLPLSDSQIAEYVGVSHPFVGKVRKSLEEAGQLETVTSRVGADGRTRNVGNIGKGKKAKSDAPPGRVYTAEEVAQIERDVAREEAERGIDRVDLGTKCFDQAEVDIACPNCGCRKRDDYGDCDQCKEPQGEPEQPKPHVARSGGENEWYTPPEIVEPARKAMGGIDLDPASCQVAQETIRAKRFYTSADDGLSKKWKGRVWMNPPYSRDLCPKFAAKFLEHVEAGDVSQACLLVNNATETLWMQSLLKRAAAVCFIAGRVRFLDREGNRANAPLQGQVMLYFGASAEKFRQECRELGPVLHPDFDAGPAITRMEVHHG